MTKQIKKRNATIVDNKDKVNYNSDKQETSLDLSSGEYEEYILDRKGIENEHDQERVKTGKSVLNEVGDQIVSAAAEAALPGSATLQTAMAVKDIAEAGSAVTRKNTIRRLHTESSYFERRKKEKAARKLNAAANAEPEVKQDEFEEYLMPKSFKKYM